MQQADQPGESTQPKKRIFISYGRQDATHVAAWLHQGLVALGYDVWLDQHDLQQATGAEWERKIEDAISKSNVVIALMSPHSVRPQSECRNEKSGGRKCMHKKIMSKSVAMAPVITGSIILI